MRKVLTITIVALLLQSCATVISGSRQNVTFNSDPPDATVYFGKYKNKYEIHKLNKSKAVLMGKTPMTISIKRNTPLIFISKEGYQDTTLYCKKITYRLKYADPQTGLVTVKKFNAGKYYSKPNWWWMGNLPFIFGLTGAVGILVDAITGADTRLDKEMNVKLVPLK